MWSAERESMQETLQRQKEEMKEDKKWLEKEEKLLVGYNAARLERDVPNKDPCQ